MTWPMILLAVGSVFSGGLFAFGGTLQHWLEPVVGAHEEADPCPPGLGQHRPGSDRRRGRYRGGLPDVRGRAHIPRVAPVRVSVLTTAARADLYGDAFNEEVFMRPGAQLTEALVEVDDAGVDGSVNALAATGEPDVESPAARCKPASPATTRCRCWQARSWWPRLLLAVQLW